MANFTQANIDSADNAKNLMQVNFSSMGNAKNSMFVNFGRADNMSSFMLENIGSLGNLLNLNALNSAKMHGNVANLNAMSAVFANALNLMLLNIAKTGVSSITNTAKAGVLGRISSLSLSLSLVS